MGILMKQIILASASPRRKELLSRMGVEFLVDTSNIEEITKESNPKDMVLELAFIKTMDVSKRYGEDSIIIGADTLVALEDKVLGKPKDKEEAYAMLKDLSGKKHNVYTGVCIIIKGEVISFAEKSDVWVSELEEEEILQYIHTGEPFDKAGGYGIQGQFAIYIERIEGDYNNIVGLPIARLYQELKKRGITLN